MREHVLRCSGTVYRYSYERDDQPRIVRILQFCFFTPQGGDGGDEEGGGGEGEGETGAPPRCARGMGRADRNSSHAPSIVLNLPLSGRWPG